MKANAGLARLIVGIVRRQKGDINGRSVSWICERGQIDCPRGSDAVWFAWAPTSRVDHLATRSRRASCRRCALPPYKGRNRGGCSSGPSIDGEPVADTAPCLQRCGCQWYARPHQYEQLRRRSPDPGRRFYLQVEVMHSFRFVSGPSGESRGARAAEPLHRWSRASRSVRRWRNVYAVGATPIPGAGTVYVSGYRTKGQWGTLEATNGVLISDDGGRCLARFALKVPTSLATAGL